MFNFMPICTMGAWGILLKSGFSYFSFLLILSIRRHLLYMQPPNGLHRIEHVIYMGIDIWMVRAFGRDVNLSSEANCFSPRTVAEIQTCINTAAHQPHLSH